MDIHCSLDPMPSTQLSVLQATISRLTCAYKSGGVGSGVQLPFDAQTAVTFPAGTNPGLHPNTISAPSVVF